MEIRLTGFEVVEKEVKRSGDSGRIYVPVTWVGTRVRAIRMERLKDKHPNPKQREQREQQKQSKARGRKLTDGVNTTEATEVTEGKTKSPLVP